MEIKASSIHIIDYDNEDVIERDPPKDFNDFLLELLSFIISNEKTRECVPRSQTIQVANNIKQITNKTIYKTDDNYNYFEDNARRLLSKEISAQEFLSSRKLDVKLQKGSLMQALVFDDTTQSLLFIFAKVEHKEFVSDEDFKKIFHVLSIEKD